MLKCRLNLFPTHQLIRDEWRVNALPCVKSTNNKNCIQTYPYRFPNKTDAQPVPIGSHSVGELNCVCGYQQMRSGAIVDYDGVIKFRELVEFLLSSSQVILIRYRCSLIYLLLIVGCQHQQVLSRCFTIIAALLHRHITVIQLEI